MSNRFRVPQGQNVIRKAIADTKAADDQAMLAAQQRQYFQSAWHEKLEGNTRAAEFRRKNKT